jgi:ABC-type nitrate/sulfonate/bicarbonate transport system permease component
MTATASEAVPERRLGGSVRDCAAAFFPSLVSIAVAIGVWALVATVSGVADKTPSPWQVVRASGKLWRDHVFTRAIPHTAETYVSGWLIAVGIGLVLGALLANSVLVRETLTPLLELLRPVPSVALIPLAILFFGLGNTMKITIIVYASTWPVLLTAEAALRRVDPVLGAVCHQFGLRGRVRLFFRVQLPSVLPELVTAMRTSSIIAMALTFVAELVSTGQGVGNWIVMYEQALRPAEMYACIVLVMLLGSLVYTVSLAVERRVIRWAPRRDDG